MRSRVIKMIATAVTVAVLLLGIPSVILGGILVWQAEENHLRYQAQSLANTVERRLHDNETVDTSLVQRWIDPKDSGTRTHVTVSLPQAPSVVVGESIDEPSLAATVVTTSRVVVRWEVPARTATMKILTVATVLIGGMVTSLLVGWWLALRGSRQISAPLIYLAAQAEQIGSGQVRACVKHSGIEEIDLVQDELVRTGERMAARLAAERQFAANASHQLRTPLTALSMRLEEIELLTDDDEVRNEARVCLEQVERLTGVIDDLLNATKQTGANTEAVDVLEIFNQQREEWEEAFTHAGRELIFTDEAAQPVLADRSVLAQVLATLIENSLRYGDGTTRVVARAGTSSRGVFIVVNDEGEGIPSELEELIFQQGVSGHGSSGIGLPLARDLMSTVGGRLELTNACPAEFTISLATLPKSLAPDLVMPKGAVVSVGRRRRRF